VDRGIVPGAFESIGDFVRGDTGANQTDTDIGLLQSEFV
jgi:hypothetical protein